MIQSFQETSWSFNQTAAVLPFFESQAFSLWQSQESFLVVHYFFIYLFVPISSISWILWCAQWRSHYGLIYTALLGHRNGTDSRYYATTQQGSIYLQPQHWHSYRQKGLKFKYGVGNLARPLKIKYKRDGDVVQWYSTPRFSLQKHTHTQG